VETLKADWNFYMAYNMFRIAAILQGIAKRVVDGTASSADAASSGASARPLAQLAWEFARNA
jgi:aminoglycoside phosphotransferase (APT) family kinase protein